MTQDESGLAESVKYGVIDAIRGAGEITDAVVDTAASSLVNAIQKSSDVGVALTATASEVVRGAIQGTAKVGGALGSAAKGAMIGVLRGTKEVGAESLDLNGSEATAFSHSPCSLMTLNACPDIRRPIGGTSSRSFLR